MGTVAGGAGMVMRVLVHGGSPVGGRRCVRQLLWSNVGLTRQADEHPRGPLSLTFGRALACAAAPRQSWRSTWSSAHLRPSVPPGPSRKARQGRANEFLSARTPLTQPTLCSCQDTRWARRTGRTCGAGCAEETAERLERGAAALRRILLDYGRRAAVTDRRRRACAAPPHRRGTDPTRDRSRRRGTNRAPRCRA